MKLSQFKYNLPQENIAQYPDPNRDGCRLMVLHSKTGDIEHKQFIDLLARYDEHDLFVFNDTRVFPARLYANKEKTGARIEVFLLRELNEEFFLWDVIVDPARKIRIGNKLFFGEDESVVAEVIDNTTNRGRTLRFLYEGDHEEFKRSLYALGEAPIPRYLGRETEPEDLERYQTIFARNEGAITVPATGLHFSRQFLKRMEIRGIDSAFCTFHCGLGHFQSADVEDLSKNKTDSEDMVIGAECCDAINKARREGHKVCAIGTSVMRAIETAVVGTEGTVRPYEGWTNKFIYPPYTFNVCESMVCNFYLPLTSQLMLVTAYGGYDNVMNAYEVAVKEGYKFGPYGDAMLVVE
ncbi:MAG: tRNA preQ1(34) S-adenosylmethionine ribosyltransferase-isomerase QueA [Bacteroidaceae bacterium]|nr:tRNA preQ1(34) S-adenosylmethionine ribosyltransferase-isomerase QueA [Bacteroidaceae bacterium]